MSKFQCGQQVWLFNSLSLRVEDDIVHAALFVPVPIEGVTQDSGKSIRERLEAGQMKVQEQYQLVGHQGIIDADILFGSEEECLQFYRDFFAKK